MKIFIYKTAIITIVFAIVFEILIGSRINDFKKQINEITTKQNREKIMIKIKDEIQKANQKENYFTTLLLLKSILLLVKWEISFP